MVGSAARRVCDWLQQRVEAAIAVALLQLVAIVGLGAVLLHALAPAALRVYAPWLLLGLAFCAGLGLGAVVWRAVYGESAMSGTPLGYLSVALGSASSTRDAALLPAEARVEPPHPPRARLAHWPASHLAPA